MNFGPDTGVTGRAGMMTASGFGIVGKLASFFPGDGGVVAPGFGGGAILSGRVVVFGTTGAAPAGRGVEHPLHGAGAQPQSWCLPNLERSVSSRFGRAGAHGSHPQLLEWPQLLFNLVKIPTRLDPHGSQLAIVPPHPGPLHPGPGAATTGAGGGAAGGGSAPMAMVELISSNAAFTRAVLLCGTEMRVCDSRSGHTARTVSG